jgi:exopolyphosphatase/guanosine-5'-triphosphate,3'-diphosphate pyrophosphatase
VRGLAAILRLADALDREHKQKIESVRAAVDRGLGQVTLFLRGDGDRELEEWTVRAKASLWRDEYDLDVAVARAEVNPARDPRTAEARARPAQLRRLDSGAFDRDALERRE